MGHESHSRYCLKSRPVTVEPRLLTETSVGSGEATVGAERQHQYYLGDSYQSPSSATAT